MKATELILHVADGLAAGYPVLPTWRRRRSCLGSCVGLFSLQRSLRRRPSRALRTRYRIAYTSFAPVDVDLFIADADGSGARPFSPSPALDFDASFSSDGAWVVFSSTRDGDADIYRAHPDGSALERLVASPGYDAQAGG